jgi:hypothetical protein
MTSRVDYISINNDMALAEPEIRFEPVEPAVAYQCNIIHQCKVKGKAQGKTQVACVNYIYSQHPNAGLFVLCTTYSTAK